MTEVKHNQHKKRNEVHRALLRMASNYARLFISVTIGLLLVRIIISHWGNDAWALIALLGGTLGIAAMLQDIVRQSMIRELAFAHHSGNRDEFLSMYNSALLVTHCVGWVTLMVVILIAIILPILEIPPDLLEVARWLVVAKGLETVFAIWVGAPMNMYIATERMALSNFWIVLKRACPIVAVLWLIKIESISDPIEGLKAYAVLSSSLFIAVSIIAVSVMMLLDNRMVPRPKYISRKSVRELLHIGGWNAVSVTSLGMHIRVDAILMNLFMGLGGNLIYGFTSQLTSYVRMLSMGVSYGLDAVTTRIDKGGNQQGVRQLCYHITRLNSCIALPAAAGLFVLAEPLLYFWVGDRMTNPETDLALTTTLIRIMVIGMAIRSLTDGWIKILYGSGNVSRYAPIILGGVIANPVLAIILYYVLPEHVRFVFAVLAYSLVFIFFNLYLLPRLMGRLFETSYSAILSPVLKPLVMTLISAILLEYMASQVDTWGLYNFLGVCVMYGTLYGILVLLFVITPDEKQSIRRLIK